MLFATNRMPRGSVKTSVGRRISFDPQDTTVSQNMFFCGRKGENNYVEIGNDDFFTRLKQDKYKQILLFIHGFNNPMEEGVFDKAIKLQQLLDADKISDKSSTRVVPLIWPCDDDGAAYWMIIMTIDRLRI